MPARRASGPPQKLDPAQVAALQAYAANDGDDRTTFWGRANWYYQAYGGLTPAFLAVLVDQMEQDTEDQSGFGDDQSDPTSTTPSPSTGDHNPYAD